MTDQAHDYATDDSRAGAAFECQTAGTFQSAGGQLSTLPDPCTSAQVAAVLGKSPKTLVDWCQEREYTNIPCFRLGNRWYHHVPELIRWLNDIRSGQIEFRRRPRHGGESGQRRSRHAMTARNKAT